ncbi:MAG TPA: TnsA endonuclease N-terminal domain-containing protein [Pyrinomonadaceae bacterium]|nr:TnsA endonuclease N-terminal domain-containing protein [Pyrinomonadaceae bacterium]
MLNSEEFEQWCERINISEAAKAEIERIRTSPPARRVQSRGRNVKVHFNRSTKMAHTIQAESRSVEFAAILLMEYPSDVLGLPTENVIEVWDQPPSFIINYTSNKGKNIGHVYTADFFVIREKSAGWEEWKVEDNLIELASKNTERYFLDDGGKWHAPPCEQYAEAFGLYFHVHSSKEINSVLLRNAHFFIPYYRRLGEYTDDSISMQIASMIAETPGITLAELLDRAGQVQREQVYDLILAKQIYTDLSAAWLGDEDQVLLFRDQTEATFFTRLAEHDLMRMDRLIRASDLLCGTYIILDGTPLELINVGKTEVMLRNLDGEYPVIAVRHFETLLRDGKVTNYRLRPSVNSNDQSYEAAVRKHLTREQMLEALTKNEIVKRILAGERVAKSDNEARKHRNWVAEYLKAEVVCGNGLVGLMPKKRKGNTIDRLALIHPNLRQMMIDFISTAVENPKQITNPSC